MVALLERLDLLFVLHHEADIVEAFEQTLLVIRVDVEAVSRAVGPRNNRGAESIVLARGRVQAARRRLFGAAVRGRSLLRAARTRTYGAGAGSRMSSSAGMRSES